MHSAGEKKRKTVDEMLDQVSIFDMINVISGFQRKERSSISDQEYVENVIKENVSLKKRIEQLRRRNAALLQELELSQQNTSEIVKKRISEKRALLDEIKDLRTQPKGEEDEGEVEEKKLDVDPGMNELKLENENLKMENSQLKERLVIVVERAEEMKRLYVEYLKKNGKV